MNTPRLLALALIVTTAVPLTEARAANAGGTKAVMARLPKGIGGTWTLDPVHSRVGFSIRHMMVNNVVGNFKKFSGTIKVDEKSIGKSSVEFKAEVASIDTDVAPRDEHLRGPDFFDVAKYPNITFKSNRIQRTRDGFKAYGMFSMHGVTKALVIPFTVSGPVNDGWGSWRTGITSTLSIDRSDYGLKYNQKFANGLALGNTVKISLDLEAIKPMAKKAKPKKP